MFVFMIFATLIMMILPCYRVIFQVDMMPDEFTYTEHHYERGKFVIEPQSTIVRHGDEFYKMLKQILTEESEGWKYYVLSEFVPNRVFESSTMEINCIRSGVVIQYTDRSNTRVQIVKTTGGGCPSVRMSSDRPTFLPK